MRPHVDPGHISFGAGRQALKKRHDEVVSRQSNIPPKCRLARFLSASRPICEEKPDILETVYFRIKAAFNCACRQQSLPCVSHCLPDAISIAGHVVVEAFFVFVYLIYCRSFVFDSWFGYTFF